MTNLDSILKSRDITLPPKVCLVNATVFPVVMYGCESWTIKKAEHRRIDAFELWCWRRLLRVPWTARRSSQSILKASVLGVHWKDWCWSWSSNTLATWCEELTCLKRPDAQKDWRWEEKGTTEDEMVGWHHWLDGHGFEQAPGVGDGWGGLACCSPWGHKQPDTHWATELNQSQLLCLHLRILSRTPRIFYYCSSHEAIMAHFMPLVERFWMHYVKVIQWACWHQPAGPAPQFVKPQGWAAPRKVHSNKFSVMPLLVWEPQSW